MLFRKRRMKQDDKQKTNDNIELDNVPFPDEKAGGHCCCHRHAEDESAHGCESDEGEHECQCQKDAADGEPHKCCCHGEEDSASDEAQAEILARIDAITTENAALRDMLVRSTADFDNFRKRVVREKEDARKTANADLVSALIPVLDTMALAMSSARQHHPEASGVIDGVDMIVSQFKNVLKANGVEEIIPAPGADFDPNIHESITTQPSDTIEEGKITTVARTGYILNGRLIRAASVILSSGKAQ
jgi:molecular chaperone GrpE